jgi:hypothetical protein
MKLTPYFCSESVLPITSDTRIAASMLKTRKANARVSHSKATSFHSAEREPRVGGLPVTETRSGLSVVDTGTELMNLFCQ